MMDDNKSKNYNSILVSIISELLFENDNSEIDREECYSYLVNNLKIQIQKDVFIRILEKSQNFVHTSNPNYVGVKLTDKKYEEINDNIAKHSINKHINDFIEKKKLPIVLRVSIESLLFHAIYENINSFTVKNIDSIIPINAKEKFRVDEIDAFNSFLNDPNLEKNTVLFNIFLKAVEFAILTSGKGVSEFTQNIFSGKQYFLDTNIIFRLLGIGGTERQSTLINLIKQCNHQGIKFFYTGETYQEFKRKVVASTLDIKKATESKSIDLLEEMIKDKVEFNQGFIIHYTQCKIDKQVRTPDQYEAKIMADFKTLCSDQNITFKSFDEELKQKNIEKLQDDLFKSKKAINHFSRYSKTAAKVDATNILSVNFLRGQNNYNYSDIKSFYLSTDRTLNNILAKNAGDKIAETILPSQLFILHNSLSDNGDEKDYEAFTKFLKRRTTEFKYTGRQVLTYIDEIRSHTTEPKNIKEILKAYSDKKYETSLDIDVEPEYISIKEFAETYADSKFKHAEIGDEKYKKALEIALAEFPIFLDSTKTIMKIIDGLITILLIPISIFCLKKFIDNTAIIIVGTLFIEGIKLLLSSRFDIYSGLSNKIFMSKVKKSSFHKTFKKIDSIYINQAIEFISKGIKIWT
jgi:predicted nucleic acid-binding protein